MIDEAIKKEINEMSYYDMLKKWRFAPIGDLIFQGEIGEYFAKIMAWKKSLISPYEQVRISKEIGWDDNR